MVFAAVVCPRVCNNCHGPIRYYRPTGEWYCSPSGENLVTADWRVIDARVEALKANALPGRAWPLFLAAVPLLALVLVPLFVALGRQLAEQRQAIVPALDQQIAELEAALHRAGGSKHTQG